MQLEQSFTLPFAASSVWPMFADVPMLVACMPGASLQSAPRVDENGTDIDLIFTVKLGPIVGAFQGQGRVVLEDAHQQGVFTGHGSDRKSGSRVKGEAKFALSAVDNTTTRVDVKVDYAITGTLAQFSRGAIVKELAAALTRDFAANLKQRAQAALRSASSPAGGTVTSAPFPAPAATSTAAAETTPEAHTASVEPAPTQHATQSEHKTQALNAGGLLWRVLWARLRALFSRAPS